MNANPTLDRLKHSGWRRIAMALFLALAAAMGPAASAQARRLALVIGNDTYRTIKPLVNARNDARRVAEMLRAAGFEVVEKNDLDRSRFLDEVEVMQRRIAKGDEVIFFFAGHGVQIGSDAVLLPIDIAPTSSGRVKRDGVPLLDVSEALQGARLSLLIVDACRDNPFPRVGDRAVGDARGLEVPAPAEGQAIIMSASRGQTALDQVPGEAAVHNGLFTHEFVEVMRQPGQNLRDALEAVRERVRDKAAKVNHPQKPALLNEMSGQFYLFPPRSPQVVAQAGEAIRPASPPLQGSGISLDDIEREDKVRREWAQWQARMKTDFDRVAALKVGSDLVAKAWERFLANWAQDNPYSSDDERLRGLAGEALRRAQGEVARLARPVESGKTQRVAPSGRTDLSVFRDCEDCPEMVVIPAGSFLMGSPASEEGRNEDEGPQRRVTIERFAMSKTAVTQREWKAVMGNNPSHFESCGGDCPVERVSWYDVQQYIRRLSEKTGQRYLLPSESEWEYAARGGSMTTYPWGNGVGSDRANCDGCGSEWDNKSTAPVKSFSPNRFGLHIIGNVWEWVQDCWDPHAYIKAPSDGTAYEPTACPNRGLRGGSWYSRPLDARSASRYVGEGYKGSLYVGFRIVRVLP